MDFFLVHRNPQMVQIVKDAVSLDTNLRLVGTSTSASEAMFHLGSSTAKVVLLQFNQPDIDGFVLLSQINQKYPDIYVVPILEGNEGGQVWQKILQLNLRDVIVGMMDVKSTATVLLSASQRAQELSANSSQSSGVRGQSYMMTVASARGGTGKSIFATNLILSMIKQKAQACFIDYSMAAGDFFTMMDFVPRNTLVEAIAQGKEIDAQYLASLLADHSLGFSFLACPNHDFDFYSFDYESALNLLKVSRQLSPYVVVDTGVADLHSTLAAIDEADLVFLITNRDLARLLSMQRMLKLHASRGVMMEKIKIIINNAEVGTEISESEIESVLEHPVSAYLPSNPLQTTFSINSGQPLVAGKLELPLCKVIHRLSELCLNHWKD